MGLSQRERAPNLDLYCLENYFDFHTDEAGKVVKINGKAVQSLEDGEIAFRGYVKNSDKLVTTEVEFYVMDTKKQLNIYHQVLT